MRNGRETEEQRSLEYEKVNITELNRHHIDRPSSRRMGSWPRRGRRRLRWWRFPRGRLSWWRFGGRFSSMRGGHTFGRGGTRAWGGRNWSGNWRHHRFSNDVFIGDFGFPWWWGYPYGYYGYDYYPYDYYGYGYYGDSGYGHRYGS